MGKSWASLSEFPKFCTGEPQRLSKEFVKTVRNCGLLSNTPNWAVTQLWIDDQIKQTPLYHTDFA